MIPTFAGRKTLINASVGPEQQPLTDRRLGWLVFVFRFGRFGRRGSARLNDKRVAVRMDFFGKIFPKIFPAVVRYEQCETEQINTLIVRRVDADLAEIKRTRVHCTGARPFFTAVFGSKDAAALAAQIGQLAGTSVIALRYCHDNFRIGRAKCETNAAGLRGQTSAQFFPSRAAVRALEDSAHIIAARGGGTGRKTPRRTLSRVERRVKNL